MPKAPTLCFGKSDCGRHKSVPIQHGLTHIIEVCIPCARDMVGYCDHHQSAYVWAEDGGMYCPPCFDEALATLEGKRNVVRSASST